MSSELTPTNDGASRAVLAAAIADWIADWGQFILDSLVSLGEVGLFCWSTLVLAFHSPTAMAHLDSLLLSSRCVELAGGGPDRNVHWNGAGREQLFRI